MRKGCCESWLRLVEDPHFVFLSGDLGFMALESLQQKAAHRFINAGVAEQNMVSVAAGLAHQGFRPWVYSIAPFCYARPFEQIRNDVALHSLPVQLVGNGGGFGYGVMGATHHALEDYGILCTLPQLTAYIPAFDEDLWPIIERMSRSSIPHYLRLGISEKPKEALVPDYAAWRRLERGPGPLVVGTGPLVGGVWEKIQQLPLEDRPELWVVSELPLDRAPPSLEFLKTLKAKRRLLVFEEHVAQGGLGAMLAHFLLQQKELSLLSFRALAVQGYLSGLYGSQAFHRAENGLDPQSLQNAWEAL